MKTFLGLLALVAAIAGAAWSYARTTHIVAADHQRFERALERMRRLDGSFNQDVLRVRFRLLEDYDAFGDEGKEILQSLAELSHTPDFVDVAVKDVIDRKVAELAQLHARKAELVESFKSQNAILKNSLRYFPLAGSELSRRLATDGTQRRLETEIQELMAEMLTYSVAPAPEQERQIRNTLAQIEGWRGRHARHPEAPVLMSLSKHASTILVRRPKVDAIVEQLVSPVTAQLVVDATQLYEEQFSKAVQSVQRYRTLLYVFCGVLVAGIAYALHALRAANIVLERRRLDLARNNEELQHARDNLEKCVVRRTAELDHANESLQAANDKLRGQALYDGLTGLPNRLLLEDRLAQAVSASERRGKPFALMFVDLDRFKPVNDTFGHGVGDALLKAVALRLTACVRNSDTVARTGGDEFVVVLNEVADANTASVIAAKILYELSRPFALDPHQVSISGSIGIGIYPKDGGDLNLLKANADEAMYCAKRSGRSNYRFFTPEMRTPGSVTAADRARALAA